MSSQNPCGNARLVITSLQVNSGSSYAGVTTGVAEVCCMLSLFLAVSSCIYSFGTVSSLHPTSFLMIFILVSLIFYPGLALTVARGE